MMHCTVYELQGRMSSHEFSEWIAYSRIYPIGEDRADARMALLASVIANASGSKKKFKPEDFLPDYLEQFEKQVLQQTPEGRQTLRERLAEKVLAIFRQFSQAKKP